MCFVYVVEHGAAWGINGGCMTISHQDGTIERIPKNSVEGMTLFDRIMLSYSNKGQLSYDFNAALYLFLTHSRVSAGDRIIASCPN